MRWRSSFLTEGWLTDKIWNGIARLRGKPTLYEIEDDYANMLELETIKKAFSPEAWKALQKKFPELKALEEKESSARSDASARFARKEFLKWLHYHKNEL